MIERLTQLGRRLRLLAHRAERERDMDDEMQLHVDMETADLVRRGAGRAARGR